MKISAFGWIGVVWGVGGLVLMLVWAVIRLVPRALEPFTIGMSTFEWIAYVVSVVFIGYTEGYRGFQKQFSPRVAVRAKAIAETPYLSWVLLAPAFCAGHFAATRKRLIVSWVITFGVVALVIAVRYVEQPWRGIVDGGVVVGLSWGTVAIVVYTIQTFRGHPPDISPDIE